MLANRTLALCFSTLLLILAGCSDSSDRRPDDGGEVLPPEPEFLPISEPTVELPPDEGEPVLISTFFDFEEVGFVQEEFFLSGTATSFTNLNELGTDGRWEAEPAEEAEYKTRVLVYRPANEADL